MVLCDDSLSGQMRSVFRLYYKKMDNFIPRIQESASSAVTPPAPLAPEERGIPSPLHPPRPRQARPISCLPTPAPSCPSFRSHSHSARPFSLRGWRLLSPHAMRMFEPWALPSALQAELPACSPFPPRFSLWSVPWTLDWRCCVDAGCPRPAAQRSSPAPGADHGASCPALFPNL